MICKTFEIRDEGTHIPALAVQLDPGCETDRYVFARAGYGPTREQQAGYIVLAHIEGGHGQATSDPFAWPGRTMREAHRYIEAHWSNLESGEVIDVQFILGETTEKKKTEACRE